MAPTRTDAPESRSVMTRSHHAMGRPRPARVYASRHPARPGRDEHPRLEGHLLGAPHRENELTDDKRALVNQIARTNRCIGRAWTSKRSCATSTASSTDPGRPPVCAAVSPPPVAAASTPRSPGQAIRGLLRRNHHGRPDRRHQREDPTHQRPRLRTPLRPNTDLDDLTSASADCRVTLPTST